MDETVTKARDPAEQTATDDNLVALGQRLVIALFLRPFICGRIITK